MLCRIRSTIPTSHHIRAAFSFACARTTLQAVISWMQWKLPLALQISQLIISTLRLFCLSAERMNHWQKQMVSRNEGWCPSSINGRMAKKLNGIKGLKGISSKVEQTSRVEMLRQLSLAVFLGFSKKCSLQWDDHKHNFQRIETTSLFLKNCKVFLQSKATFSVFATFSLTCLKLRHDALTA